MNALSYLGIDHVRDQAPNPAYDAYGQAHFAQAAAQGVHFTFFAEGGVDPGTVVSRIRAIEQAHPGAITAIEGLNEINNWPVTYTGQGGTGGAQSYMRDLFDAVQADPLLRDVPVSGFTDWPNNFSVSDLNTIHPYAKNGDQPRGRILQDMADQNAVSPGKDFIITETGYHTKINASGGGWEGVSEDVQAKLVLNTYMSGVELGAKKVYIYQLLDAYAGNSQEEHFGLFRLDNSPKPAATAIHNLTTILADTAGNAGSFGRRDLDFTVSNAPASGHTLLAEKSNGIWQLITWAEPDIWNEDANQAIAVRPTTQTISFDQTFQTVEIFDPLLGTSPIRTFSNVNTVNVDVTDHPLIIQLSGSGTWQPPASAPAVTRPEPSATPQEVVVSAAPAAVRGPENGTDTLELRISQDAWQGNAQYTVTVDGTQTGGVYTAKALHANGQSDSVMLTGAWGSGERRVSIDFLNDAYEGTAETDRNLYVDDLIYNGVGHSDLARWQNSAGAQDYVLG